MDSHLVDPLGRRVVLQDRTWFGHVVKGHPDVAGARRLVEQAVSRPLEIRHSAADDDCRLFFGRGPRKAVMIVVVADVVRGVVKTAHLAKKLSGGAIEWSRRTP
jgi:hypothetical protein